MSIPILFLLTLIYCSFQLLFNVRDATLKFARIRLFGSEGLLQEARHAFRLGDVLVLYNVRVCAMCAAPPDA
jgi:hypothetical protein